MVAKFKITNWRDKFHELRPKYEFKNEIYHVDRGSLKKALIMTMPGNNVNKKLMDLCYL